MRSAPTNTLRAAARLVLAMLMLALAAPAPAQRVRFVIQDSPLAGFRYHDAAAVFAELAVGDRLELVREPDNPYDAAAIRVYWGGRKLGYVPRRHNAALAWALDSGERVVARVSRLAAHPNPRERIRFEVLIE
jgi:hypothetical protein